MKEDAALAIIIFSICLALASCEAVRSYERIEIKKINCKQCKVCNVRRK